MLDLPDNTIMIFPYEGMDPRKTFENIFFKTGLEIDMKTYAPGVFYVTLPDNDFYEAHIWKITKRIKAMKGITPLANIFHDRKYIII